MGGVALWGWVGFWFFCVGVLGFHCGGVGGGGGGGFLGGGGGVFSRVNSRL